MIYRIIRTITRYFSAQPLQQNNNPNNNPIDPAFHPSIVMGFISGLVNQAAFSSPNPNSKIIATLLDTLSVIALNHHLSAIEMRLSKTAWCLGFSLGTSYSRLMCKLATGE